MTDERIELDENAKYILDEKLRIIQEHFDDRPKVSITYFRPDEKKGRRLVYNGHRLGQKDR